MTFACLDEEGKHSTAKGFPRPISIRDILSLQLKICFRKDVNCMQLMWKSQKGPKDQDLKII